MKNNRHTIAITITTIAMFMFGLFWKSVDGKLEALDIRLRSVEQQVAAISARLGVENKGQISSQDMSGSLFAAPWLADLRPEIPIIP